MSNMKNLSVLENEIGYTFKNKGLLTRSLTHRSFLNESHDKSVTSNERMEFLGDAILDAAVSDYVFRNYPDINEGKMTKIRAVVVCEDGLFDFAKRINLGRFILLSKGEDSTGGREKHSILSDAAEALIAAVYLDSDFNTVFDFIIRHFEDSVISAIKNNKSDSDYKSRLQEYASSKGHDIKYEVIGQKGPEHEKIFTVAVIYNGKKTVTAEGHGKKKAEQQAARLMLEKLK